MIFTSLIIVAPGRLPLTRACLEDLRETSGTCEVCVVDNGSTDGTADYFRHFPLSHPLRYHRNDRAQGLITALNQGARLATGTFLCFLQPDLEPKDPRWLDRLRSALMDAEDVGLAGLAGARRLRRDGRYARRSVVHSLEGRGTLRSAVAEVAAVDEACLFLRRDLLERVGGFDEEARLVRGYGRDLSLAVRELGLRCVVVRAPFARRQAMAGDDRPDAALGWADEARHEAAIRRFVRKWRRRLPCDVRGFGDRLVDWLAWPLRARSLARAEC